MYAEGEYNHPMPHTDINLLAPHRYHWRNYCPSTYYLTHSLAPLMHMTGSMPAAVNAKSIFTPELHEGTAKMYGDGAAVMLCEMDNGALFRVTGCAGFGGHGNWYRLACTKATAEMVRGQEDKVLLRYNEWDKPEGVETVSTYVPQWPEHGDLAEKAGHGGGDFWEMYHFVRYITEDVDPFFNVYRSAAMSAVGILGWRSALNGGKEYKIPDFTKEEDCLLYENDHLSPFPDENGKTTMPCSSRPYEPTREDIQNAIARWKEMGVKEFGY